MAEMTIYDACLKITGAFEGRGFGTVVGSFDGQGLSAGMLQWNVGSGTLQNLILGQVNLMAYDFPVPIDPILKLSPRDAVVWCKDVMHDESGKLTDEWRKAWVKFLTNPVIIEQQKKACDPYFHRAKEILGKLRISRENKTAMAWAFDVAVQVWSFDIDKPEPNRDHAMNVILKYNPDNFSLWINYPLDDDQLSLIIASHLRAMKCKEEWRKAFFDRKSVIAAHHGWAQKTKWDYKKILR